MQGPDRSLNMMQYKPHENIIAAIEKHAQPAGGGALYEYDPIVKAAIGKQFVLLGEATHGTAEFYRARSQITQRLITEEGFDAVVVEADWPDAYAVNRFVTGRLAGTAEQALDVFERFPAWMWRNRETAHFIEWLHAYNREFRPAGPRRKMPISFYGLDLYSLTRSIKAVIEYLEGVDPVAAIRARARYACFDQFIDDPQAYGYAAGLGLTDTCEQEIVSQLVEMQKRSYDYMSLNGLIGEDEYFAAEQNARVVHHAEEYYRSLFSRHENSWNVRDRHMFETLQDISLHLRWILGREAKVVVWAHNSHVGNAAATSMAARGEVNIGQLLREVEGRNAMLVGFSTSRGTVTAASEWDGPPQVKQIVEPFAGSYEEIFGLCPRKNFILDLREPNEMVDLLREPKLQRAIGVVYRPDTERVSHYYHARLPEQFDFMIHLSETTALEPLETRLHPERPEYEETFPFGL
jgi:erythromycin esterase-like protein